MQPRPLGVSHNPLDLTPASGQPDDSIQGALQNDSNPLSLKEPQPTLSTFVLSRVTSWLPLKTEDLASARLKTRVSQEWDELNTPDVG